MEVTAHDPRPSDLVACPFGATTAMLRCEDRGDIGIGCRQLVRIEVIEHDADEQLLFATAAADQVFEGTAGK